MPKLLLQIEALTLFILATVLYFYLNGSLALYLVLILAPDIGILGYATRNARIGSYIYNLFHTYSLPFALGGAAFWYGPETLLLVSLIWVAHIGMDRVVGYGLKYETHFTHTHMQRL